jgi:hypothetical protein
LIGYNDTEFAGMALPAKQHDDLLRLLTLNCCATATKTKALFNIGMSWPSGHGIRLAIV